MGLRELEKGYQQQDSIRRVMCAMIILGYHLLVLYVLGTGEGNLVQARSILDEQLKARYIPYVLWRVVKMLSYFRFSCSQMAPGSCSSKAVWSSYRLTLTMLFNGIANLGNLRISGLNFITSAIGSWCGLTGTVNNIVQLTPTSN